MGENENYYTGGTGAALFSAEGPQKVKTKAQVYFLLYHAHNVRHSSALTLLGFGALLNIVKFVLLYINSVNFFFKL